MRADSAVASFRAAMTPHYVVGPGAVRYTLEQIQWAESIGYDDVWLADAGGIDALTMAAIALQNTRRIRVGIAVVPAYTRTPAVLAATVATLADLAPGRFALGLGTSSEAMIAGWHGLSLDRPVPRMRETMALLRTILAGEKTAFEGETLRSNGYSQPPLASPVPVLLAALGPRMTDLAAADSDGVILNLVPLPVADTLIGRIRTAAAAVGRESSSVEISSRVPVLVTDDPDAGRNAFRRLFAPYYANPVYNRFMAWCGYPSEAAILLEAARAGDWRRARAAMPDPLVDSIAIIGDAAQCRKRLRALIDAGITTPIVCCLSPDLAIQTTTYTALAPAAIQTQP
ncbi:LLM class flavin-dependent oxidoreductase [Nocardia vinacea]|uniref:LLM class flavin-dependent oxidoreductase n=1 Tax=Nocardia vinacea TaxID=96468 RepID=A0ABZ1YT88_9NOCA|nr:LLM class flavin-dependent oxidoreductase [Nocardia vinacea]